MLNTFVKRLCFLFMLSFLSLLFASTQLIAGPTKVIMLGTGTPFNDATHSGQSIAVIVYNRVYLVDFGPGVMRQFDAAKRKGFKGFPSTTMRPFFLKTAFLTHLDSDHTMGIADIILTPWVLGRKVPLELYGPPGTDLLAKYTLKAFNNDIMHRIYGSQPSNSTGYKVNTHIIKEQGVVYKDENLEVKSFNVKHGDWLKGKALGFRFTTDDKTVVMSGDTTYYKGIIDNYRGADILIHEVYSMKGLAKRTASWQKYHKAAHTSTKQLGEIANIIKPKLLVLNHVLFFGESEQEILDELHKYYKGKVVLAHDLDVY